MQKVICHNLTIPYSNPARDTFDFDQLGMFFAEPGDIVVMRKPPDAVYLSFLERIGISLKGVRFLSLSSPYGRGPHSLFQNEQLTQNLRDLIKNKEYALDSFLMSSWEEEWAKSLGLSYVGSAEHFYRFGNKSVFRRLAKREGLPVPRGYEHLNSPLDGALAAAWLFVRGALEVIVKDDEGVAGLGSQRITRGDLLSRLSDFDELFDSKARTLDYIVPTKSSGFVVETWHRDVRSFPSIQCYIGSDGRVSEISIHNQTFYKNKMTYRGCESFHFLTDAQIGKIQESAILFMEDLAKEGFRGHGALGGIMLPDGALLWTDLNPRRVISSYAHHIVSRVSEQLNRPLLCYKTTRVRNPDWIQKDIAHVLRDLSESLFSRQKNEGVIPYYYGLLQSQGELSLLFIAPTKEAVYKLERSVLSRFWDSL